jgi:hypothetical protein
MRIFFALAVVLACASAQAFIKDQTGKHPIVPEVSQ